MCTVMAFTQSKAKDAMRTPLLSPPSPSRYTSAQMALLLESPTFASVACQPNSPTPNAPFSSRPSPIVAAVNKKRKSILLSSSPRCLSEDEDGDMLMVSTERMLPGRAPRTRRRTITDNDNGDELDSIVVGSAPTNHLRPVPFFLPPRRPGNLSAPNSARTPTFANTPSRPTNNGRTPTRASLGIFSSTTPSAMKSQISMVARKVVRRSQSLYASSNAFVHSLTSASTETVPGDAPASANPALFKRPSESLAPGPSAARHSQEAVPVLPCFKVKQDPLNRISAETFVSLMDGRYADAIDGVRIIDCRFPYEFDGGHIRDAVNINTQEQLDSVLLGRASLIDDSSAQCFPLPLESQKIVTIFHCEYSSHRAPRLAMYLREQDRLLNIQQYPTLFYPELYVLDGGYRSFFANYKERCFPQQYVEMKAEEHRYDCKERMRQIRRTGSMSGLGTMAGAAISRSRS